jgi:hypothetical protein
LQGCRSGHPVRSPDGAIVRDKTGKIYFFTEVTSYDTDIPSEIKDSVKWSDYNNPNQQARTLKHGRLQLWVLSYIPTRAANEDGALF